MEDKVIYQIRRPKPDRSKQGFVTRYRFARRIRAQWRLLTKYFRYKTPAEVAWKHSLARYELATRAWENKNYQLGVKFYRLVKFHEEDKFWIARFRAYLGEWRNLYRAGGILQSREKKFILLGIYETLALDYYREFEDADIPKSLANISNRQIAGKLANLICTSQLNTSPPWRGLKLALEINKAFVGNDWSNQEVKTSIRRLADCHKHLRQFLNAAKVKDLKKAEMHLKNYFRDSKDIPQLPSIPFKFFEELKKIAWPPGIDFGTGNILKASDYYYMRGYYKNALSWNKLYEDFFGRTPMMLYYRASYLEGQGRHQEAIKCLQEALLMDEKSVSIRHSLAYLLFHNSDERQALHIIFPVRRKPEGGGCYHHMQAMLLKKEGRFEKAKREILKAMRINPSCNDIYRRFTAKIFRKQGDYLTAGKILENILERDPLNGNARADLADLMEVTGGAGASYQRTLADVTDWEESWAVKTEIREMVEESEKKLKVKS